MSPPRLMTPDPPQRPPPGPGRPSGKPPSGKGPSGKPGPPSPYRFTPLWWVILIALGIWNLWAFFPRQTNEVTLPYSGFVDQLRAGNVTQVHIAGETITGTFGHAIVWPRPATEPAPSGGANPAKPSPSAAPNSPAASAASTKPGQGASASTAATSHGGSANTARNTHAAQKPNSAPSAPQAAPAGSTAPNTTRSAPKASPAGTQQPQSYARFTTTFPSVIGDPSLMPLLQQHRVVITVAATGTPWFALLLSYGLPLLLMIGVLFWMGQQASKSQSGIFGFARNRARRYTADRPKVTFADVAGADEAKQDLTEVVDFLRQPAKYLAIGARIPRGVLLVGPPGTGKTLLARAVAGEAGVPFFHMSGSEFVEMFVGVGASRVRDLFTQAKAAQPAIVFVDELDAVGRRRGAGVGNVNDEREQTLNQLLVEMDGFDERQQVILLAATNRPDVLDPALLRPGRFDRQVVVPLPDWRGRLGILRIHTRHLHLAADVDLERLARIATGLSGADLANLANESALGAARQNRNEVTMQDFEEAWDKIVLGAARDTVLSPRDRRVVAYHEGGHAVVAWLTPAADPVRKVTIVPHGRALGVTAQRPTEERYNMSRGDLLARLDVMLGGRASEALVIGEITTGAENDLVQATQLARRMITRWAMGGLGPVAFDTQGEQPFLGYQLSQGRDYSEATAARIDQEVERLLTERQAHVRRLLTEGRERLDRLATTLLKEETVGEEELVRVLGARPSSQPTPRQELALTPAGAA